MRLRPSTSIGTALVVALVAVLIDRAALRGLGIDGVARADPAVAPLPPACVAPPAVDATLEPIIITGPSPARQADVERAASPCGRCVREQEGYRANPGNIAFRTALEMCERKCSGATAPAPPPHVPRIDLATDEEDLQLLFEDAVTLLRDRDADRGCQKLREVVRRGSATSLWRDKAINLAARRCL